MWPMCNIAPPPLTVSRSWERVLGGRSSRFDTFKFMYVARRGMRSIKHVVAETRRSVSGDLPTPMNSAVSTSVLNEDIEQCHRFACDAKENFYTDPQTGFSVLTEHFLYQRNFCCGNVCRHCPYGHVNVSLEKSLQSKNRISRSVIILPQKSVKNVIKSSTLDCTVVLWDGDVETLLALQEEISQCPTLNYVLLTTIISQTSKVLNGTNHISDLYTKAKSLNLPICFSPVFSKVSHNGEDFVRSVRDGFDCIRTQLKLNITKLVFPVGFSQDFQYCGESIFKHMDSSFDSKFAIAFLGTSSEGDTLSRLLNPLQHFDSRTENPGAAEI